MPAPENDRRAGSDRRAPARVTTVRTVHVHPADLAAGDVVRVPERTVVYVNDEPEDDKAWRSARDVDLPRGWTTVVSLDDLVGVLGDPAGLPDAVTAGSFPAGFVGVRLQGHLPFDDDDPVYVLVGEHETLEVQVDGSTLAEG